MEACSAGRMGALPGKGAVRRVGRRSAWQCARATKRRHWRGAPTGLLLAACSFGGRGGPSDRAYMNRPHRAQ